MGRCFIYAYLILFCRCINRCKSHFGLFFLFKLNEVRKRKCFFFLLLFSHVYPFTTCFCPCFLCIFALLVFVLTPLMLFVPVLFLERVYILIYIKKEASNNAKRCADVSHVPKRCPVLLDKTVLKKRKKDLLWFSFRLPGKRKKRITKKIFFYYYWNVFFQHDSRMIYFFSFTFSPNGVSLTKKDCMNSRCESFLFYSLFFCIKKQKGFYYYPKKKEFVFLKMLLLLKRDLFPFWRPSPFFIHFPFFFVCV